MRILPRDYWQRLEITLILLGKITREGVGTLHSSNSFFEVSKENTHEKDMEIKGGVS